MTRKNKKKATVLRQCSGVCPVCGGMDLMFAPRPRYYDNLQAWDFSCMDCHAEGYEEHILTYQGTMISGNNGVDTFVEFDDIDTYYEEGSEIEVKTK